LSLTSAQIERYRRHILLPEVGAQGQQRLKSATVAIVGAGGIGSPAIAYLAAAGVGRLRMIDPDTVDLSNLQRQVVHETAGVGTAKTASAAAFVRRLNPDVDVEQRPTALDEGNARGLLAGADVVVDGVDRFPPRYAASRAAMALRTPLVSAAIGRYDGYLAVFAPYSDETQPCYRCLTPEPPPDAARCETDGVLGAVPGVLGAMAAMETLKALLGLGESLAGRLAIYAPLSLQSRIVRIPRDPACPDCSALERKAAA